MLPICIIAALPAEARPLITYFGLRTMNHPHLRLYGGDGVYLLQCGVGKLNAATTTAAMLQYLPDVAAIINVGIAGSEQPLGKAVIAHGVTDKSSDQKWFPHLPPVKRLPGLDSVQVTTVDRPVDDYSSDIAFDMEAAGIFAAAAKVLDIAFVHSIKIISDNSQSSIEHINSNSVIEHIGNAVPVVEQLMRSLPFNTLPTSNPVIALSKTLTNKFHYTATESHTLNQLLHRYNALAGKLPDAQSLLNHEDAKSVRRQLLADIDNMPVNY